MLLSGLVPFPLDREHRSCYERSLPALKDGEVESLLWEFPLGPGR